MVKLRWVHYGLLISLVTFSSCSMMGNVINTPRANDVSVQTVWTTPAYWKLSLNVKLTNNNPLSLKLSRVSYTLHSGNKKVTSKVYSSLPTIPGYKTTTIEIPVNLSLAAIHEQFPNSQKLNLAIKGDFYSESQWQKSSLYFTGKETISIPIIPTLTYEYIRALKKKPIIFMQTTNDNKVPLTLEKITGELNAGGKKSTLSLLKPIILKPGKKTLIPLNFSGTLSKKQFHQKEVYLSGEITATSSLGTMLIPIHQTLSNVSQ